MAVKVKDTTEMVTVNGTDVSLLLNAGANNKLIYFLNSLSVNINVTKGSSSWPIWVSDGTLVGCSSIDAGEGEWEVE